MAQAVRDSIGEFALAMRAASRRRTGEFMARKAAKRVGWSRASVDAGWLEQTAVLRIASMLPLNLG